jgi:hypothetical protein
LSGWLSAKVGAVLSEGRNVIPKDEMMRVLLATCPSFTPEWEAFLEEWKDKADDLPLYLALSSFARHLIGMLDRNEVGDFPTIFQAVEKLHVEGDSYVQGAATVGLLEDLQNLNLHRRRSPSSSVLTWDRSHGGDGMNSTDSGRTGSRPPVH